MAKVGVFDGGGDGERYCGIFGILDVMTCVVVSSTSGILYVVNDGIGGHGMCACYVTHTCIFGVEHFFGVFSFGWM